MKRIDRRESLILVATAFVTPVALLGCEKPLACTNTSGLTPAELTAREALAYSDTTMDSQKKCSGCQLFKPAGEKQCGSCVIVKGPINPGGSCTSWVKKG